ncbi:MAG TPA: hypothetical protein VFJ43_05455 [Bacteroidia bacterium]|nr:hypothetical protein [Bacteroidia bacterium]
MKLNKYFLLAATILLVLIGIQTGHAQPPPPPPPSGGPPCWPPPCVPVNGGIIYAVGAAVLFGAYALYKSFRSRVAE